MKYEKLNKIEVSRKVWPAGKTVKLQAYDATEADDAISELVSWYTNTKTELDTLNENSSKEIGELKEKVAELEKTDIEHRQVLEKNVETIGDYKIQVQKLTADIADKEDLIKKQNDTILRINLTSSHSLEEIDKLNKKIAELQATIDKKNDELEVHKHNLEEERNAVKVLNDKNKKLEEKYDCLNNTLTKISELSEFYKNYAKTR